MEIRIFSKKDTYKVSFPFFDHVKLGDQQVPEVPVFDEREQLVN